MLKTADMKNMPANHFAYNNIQAEALSALMALGFNKAQADNAVAKITKTKPDINTVEVLIKEALKAM
jgi:Holliday junction resolvasome RuvABC DNA-binding subunit